MTTFELIGIAKILVLFGGLIAYCAYTSRKLEEDLREMRDARLVRVRSPQQLR